MSTFDAFADAAFHIALEGESITVNFKPGVPASGQGTVEWNIPGPAQGCHVDDDRGVYAGIVILLDTKPIQIGGDRHYNPTDPRQDVTLLEDGNVYVGDPTADPDLHTGDKVGDALVVGAFYEREQRSRGEDLTTSVVINDLDPNTPYYVAAFAVDGQFRYHAEGVRAYSDSYGTNPDPATPATQRVRFERNPEAPLSGNDVDVGPQGHTMPGHWGGVLPTDGTGLTPSKIYQFDIAIDPTFPTSEQQRTVLISIDGADAGTYQDLINEINTQLAKADNPVIAPNPPDQGRYYWDSSAQKLYQWNGNQHIEQTDAFIEQDDPANIAIGDYWHDTANEQLYTWNGSSWDAVTTIRYGQDPTNLTGCDDYWFDGTNVWRWEPNTWCKETVYNQTTDPSKGTDPQCNAYWFDTDQEVLYNWNENTCKWDQVFAIMWDTDPNSLADGAFWYDETNNLLKVRDVPNSQFLIVNQKGTQPVVDYPDTSTIEIAGDYAGTFTGGATLTIQGGENQGDFTVDSGGATFSGGITTIPITGTLTDLVIGQDRVVVDTLESKSTATFIQKTKPSNPADKAYWYQTTTEQLFQYDSTTDTFNELNVLVWPDDPTDRTSCDLWWDTSSDQLKVWSELNNQWEIAPVFVQADTDPYGPEDLVPGDTWYNPDTAALKYWDGSQWNETTHINLSSDPTNPTIGDAWLDISDDAWYVWNGSWTAIDPIQSDSDPTTVPQGALWFDLTQTALKERIGSSWVAITFSTKPLTPKKGELYFDTSLDKLREWNGSAWVDGTPLATVTLDDNGLMLFETTFTGSTSCIMIIVPQHSQTGISSDPNIATGKVDHHESEQNDWWLAGSIWHHYFNHHGSFYGTNIPITSVPAEQFLFDNLLPAPRIQPQVYGNDGVYHQPSYQQVGVGDDGSPDERRELMESVRAQLGYPTVDVELTTYQLDQAITGALEEFRKRSSSGYTRGYYFLDINPGQQKYRLTDRQLGYHRIVNITSAHRFTSAFLSTAHGAGAYGQVVLQHLYNMGTYDLTSFHLVSQYIEQLEHLFATRLTYHWNEQTRVLHLHHSFVYPERILLDCSVERTEQDLLVDRWTKSWIERWALMEARLILAEIRGKYASLPGAGGGVALNAQDLISRADTDRQELLQEIEDYVADNVEEWGWNSTFIIG